MIMPGSVQEEMRDHRCGPASPIRGKRAVDLTVDRPLASAGQTGYNLCMTNQEPPKEGTEKRNSRLTEAAMVLVLVLGIFWGDQLSLPVFAFSLFFVIGLFPMAYLGLHVIGVSQHEMPRVTLGQTAGLAALLALGIWAQRLPIPFVLRLVAGFAPSVLLTYLFLGPWHRFLPAGETAVNGDSDQDSNKKGTNE